jgi:large conductance mechanosensitive channel
MKKFFKEFGDFIKRGNVLDLAVGLIIGTSFNAIVRSLVNDIIMPLIGLAGGKNIAQAKLELIAAVVENGTVVTPAVTLNYGAFLQTVIDFLIIALSIFVAVKIISSFRNRLEKRVLKYRKIDNNPEEAAVVTPAKPTTEEILLEIRDLLKKEEV